MVDTEDLAGFYELGELVGVNRRNVGVWYTWRHSNGFPNEILRLAMGPLFSKQQFLAWHGPWNKTRARKPTPIEQENTSNA